MKISKIQYYLIILISKINFQNFILFENIIYMNNKMQLILILV